MLSILEILGERKSRLDWRLKLLAAPSFNLGKYTAQVMTSPQKINLAVVLSENSYLTPAHIVSSLDSVLPFIQSRTVITTSKVAKKRLKTLEKSLGNLREYLVSFSRDGMEYASYVEWRRGEYAEEIKNLQANYDELSKNQMNERTLELHKRVISDVMKIETKILSNLLKELVSSSLSGLSSRELFGKTPSC